MDVNRNRGKRRAGFSKYRSTMSGSYENQAAADNNLGSHQFIISCAQFGRDSLFCMILGTEGGAAVIGLIRRSPDLRWRKADVEGESV